MRNWNTIFKPPKGVRVADIASLPMRNWNDHKICGGSLHSYKIASLPMRNWNLESSKSKRRYHMIASLPMRNWNDLQNSSISFSVSDCEPTYEELKQGFEDFLFCDGIKLRAYLWGIETSFASSRARGREPLRAYLWGIETCLQNKPTHTVTQLRAYLWGIETY